MGTLPEIPKSFVPGMIPTLNNTGFMTEGLDAYSQEFVSFAGSASNEVLDVGCAYGIATLAALNAGASVLAADIELGHLQILESRVPAEQRARLRTQVTTLPDSDFPDSSFDAVLAARVIHFLDGPQIGEFFRKAFSWLRPGGKLFIIADSPYTGPWAKVSADYEARKAQGEAWPALQREYVRFLSPGADASKHPQFINPMDPDILERELRAAGFVLEKCAFIAGAHPRSPANAHAAAIARKPG